VKAAISLGKSALSLGGVLSSGGLLVFMGLAIFSTVAYALSDKKFVAPITTKPAAGAKVDVAADRITFDSSTKIATATGTVRITYGPYTLVASKVVYDQDNGTFKANGSVELREPNGNILQADKVDLHNKFREGFARHVRALLTNDVTITSDYVKRTADGITVFEHASYTACKHCATKSGDPLWEITTERTVHDGNTKTLYHTNPTFRFAGVPLAWLPYAEQPDPTVKRRTGFLLPEFKSGRVYGLGVVTPYFWELGPSADLTFRPVWTTRQGPVADVEYRQALRSGDYSIRGYGVYQLRDDKPPGDVKRRGAIASTGGFKLNDDWDWGWNGTYASDKTFLDHYDFDKRSIAENQVYLVGMDDRNYFSAQALDYRSLSLDEDQGTLPTALPYINSEYTFNNTVLGGELGLDWSAYSITRDDAQTPFANIHQGTEQTRAVANLRWQNQMTTDLGHVVTPFARLRTDMFISENVFPSTEKEVTSRVLPSAGVDMRWPFIASFDTGQSIVTPVFQAIAATDETGRGKIGNEDAISVNFDSSNLFLQDRFSGRDRYEGGSRTNVGLLYTYLGENGGFARVSIGESFHVGGKNSFDLGSGLDGTKSDLVGAVTVQPWENLGVSYQARVEEDLSRINVQEAFANYSFNRLSGNIGYLYYDSALDATSLDEVERVEADSSLRFSEAWSLFGGFSYDLINDEIRSKKAGLAFDCDCMAAKLTYSETNPVDPLASTDRTVKLSVELRTIGKTSLSAGF
jgi:LPS-assembly protein